MFTTSHAEALVAQFSLRLLGVFTVMFGSYDGNEVVAKDFPKVGYLEASIDESMENS